MVTNKQGSKEMKIIAINRYYPSAREELNIIRETKSSYFVKFSSCPDMERTLRLSKKVLNEKGCEMRGCDNIRIVY
jgi:hypothetical protein